MKKEKLLGNYRKLTAEIVMGNIGQRNAVETDTAGNRVIKTGSQRKNGRFTGAARAHQGG